MENFPNWFRAETGFKFIDGDGDLVMVLGTGSFFESEPIGTLHLPDQGVKGFGLYQNKLALAKLAAVVRTSLGRWHLWDLSLEDANYWTGCKPLQDEA